MDAIQQIQIKKKKWYQELLGKKNINFKKNKNYKSSYNFLQESKDIANIDSTLGYEFLARNKKVIFISRNFKDKNINSFWNFGWPTVKSEKGFFFTNQLNESELTRILNNAFNSSLNKWNFKTSMYKKIYLHIILAIRRF